MPACGLCTVPVYKTKWEPVREEDTVCVWERQWQRDGAERWRESNKKHCLISLGVCTVCEGFPWSHCRPVKARAGTWLVGGIRPLPLGLPPKAINDPHFPHSPGDTVSTIYYCHLLVKPPGPGGPDDDTWKLCCGFLAKCFLEEASHRRSQVLDVLQRSHRFPGRPALTPVCGLWWGWCYCVVIFFPATQCGSGKVSVNSLCCE